VFKFSELSLDLYCVLAKVQKHADGFAGCRKIIDQLHFVCFGRLSYGLSFEDYGIMDDPVGDAFTDKFTFIEYLDLLLELDEQADLPQFNDQSFFINGFNKTRAHLIVDAIRTSEDPFCQFFVGPFAGAFRLYG
jgi:hypothetical protein